MNTPTSDQFEIRDLRNCWFSIDNELFDDDYARELGPYGLAVYAALTRYANHETQVCFPSYQTIADKTGMSRRQVIREMEHLEKLHLIHKTERLRDAPDGEKRHRSNLYTLLHKNQWRHGAQVGSDPQPPLPVVVTPSHHPSDSQSPDQDSCKKTHDEDEDETLISDLVDLLELAPEAAQDFITRHGPDRVTHCLAMALERGKTNPAGYFCTCLNHTLMIAYTPDQITRIRKRHRDQWDEDADDLPADQTIPEDEPIPVDDNLQRLNAIWTKVDEELRMQMTHATHDTWLLNAKLITLDDDHATVQVPSSYAVEWCSSRLITPIERTLRGILGTPKTLSMTFVSASAQQAVNN